MTTAGSIRCRPESSQRTRPGAAARLARAFAWCALLLAATGCSRPAERPNVILIVADTLRADYLGLYGFEGEISPALDALAQESIVFTDCSAPAPWTKPSMASLMTSLYPRTHGLNETGDGSSPANMLSADAVTLAERLRTAGYRTAAFVTNPWVDSTFGFAQGFDLYDAHAAEYMTPASTVLYQASSWLAAQPLEGPFFLYLHLMDTHTPYDAPRRDYDAVVTSSGLGPNRRLADDELPNLLFHNFDVPPAWDTTEMRHDVRYWRARYAAGVRGLDRRLAWFLDSLRDSGALDRSLVVFTSDHGEELFEHGGWSHGFGLYEHQLAVPLLLRLPDGASGGRRVDEPVSLVDVMPTILSLAGIATPSGAQGRDLSPLLRGEMMQAPNAIFATATQSNPDLHSVRTERHKLIVDLESSQHRLFDLTADPAEKSDISDREPGVARELMQRVRDHLARASARPFEPESADLGSPLRERLRALGYLRDDAAGARSGPRGVGAEE